MPHTWQHDKETGEHFLSLNDDESVKVYKSAAGDYVLTTHSDAIGHGGEVEYFDTLKQAKQHGEKIAKGVQPDPDGKTHGPALAG